MVGFPGKIDRWSGEAKRRLLMKGRWKIVSIAVLVLILSTAYLSAQIQNALPTDKKISDGRTYIFFDGIIYRIISQIPVEVRLSEVDESHHKIVFSWDQSAGPICNDVYVQWEDFPPVYLGIGTSCGDTYILGTETGYAEK